MPAIIRKPVAPDNSCTAAVRFADEDCLPHRTIACDEGRALAAARERTPRPIHAPRVGRAPASG